jgi:hypothetical protein
VFVDARKEWPRLAAVVMMPTLLKSAHAAALLHHDQVLLSLLHVQASQNASKYYFLMFKGVA